jgi:hypothetical protein
MEIVKLLFNFRKIATTKVWCALKKCKVVKSAQHLGRWQQPSTAYPNLPHP